MPELPEVETVKNELTPRVVGRRITGVTLLWEGMVREPSPAEFIARVTGRRITAINRRGKYLSFSLDNGEFMIVHLKMTGSLIVQKEGEELPQYTRAVIHLDNGTHIAFRDSRKFGVLRAVTDDKTITGKLGPEPLDDSFTQQVLAGILSRRKTPVKALLCEQEQIAGIGSMYADEALFAVKIHPGRPADQVSESETVKLHRAIREILHAAIENKGASVDTYYRPDGSRGTAHYQFKVAHRYKEPCPVCGTPVERTRIRQRGSYFCPHCQPE
jgi:formamidopyrimidine-DNA glycosylase